MPPLAASHGEGGRRQPPPKREITDSTNFSTTSFSSPTSRAGEGREADMSRAHTDNVDESESEVIVLKPSKRLLGAGTVQRCAAGVRGNRKQLTRNSSPEHLGRPCGGLGVWATKVQFQHVLNGHDSGRSPLR